ncbi:MAG TPA: cyclopropane-fatty-acyl-phospholipid synthase family protein [Casimicrobiaceae bacterium]
MSLMTSIAERATRSRLEQLRHGSLLLRDGDESIVAGDRAAGPQTLTVHDRRFYESVAFGGAVGAGEAYAAGWWSSGDLTGIIRLMLRNREALEGLESGPARLMGAVRRIAHALNLNTRSGARRNIRAHYDLGNDFFSLFLDETLTYSCALFERPDVSLAEASVAKYDRIAKLLELQPSDHLVEIGTGWGGFAIHAASRYGCRVTTTTISEAQLSVARRRIAEAGLSDRVTAVGLDYRDLTGRYDKLASIEMIEAIGHEQYETFFRKVAGLVAPHGRAAIQAITIADDRYEAARREVDFIKRYIFPGACMPSRAALGAAARAANLELVQADEIGLHYAETLRRWRDNLLENRDRIRALGYDDWFLRLWEFYLCYCEGGFLERAIGTAQLVYTHEGASVTAPLPVAAVPPAPVEQAA